MRARQNNQSRRGATCVEFALVAPLLFFITLATIELWRVNVIVHMADQAAYEAARAIMIPGATAQTGIDAAERVMAIAGAKNVVVDVEPDTINDETPQVTVTVTVPMAGNGWVAPRVYSSPTAQASITLKRETILD